MIYIRDLLLTFSTVTRLTIEKIFVELLYKLLLMMIYIKFIYDYNYCIHLPYEFDRLLKSSIFVNRSSRIYGV